MDRMKFWLTMVLCPLIMIAGMYQVGYMLGYGEFSAIRFANVLIGAIAAWLFFKEARKAPLG